MVWQPLSTGIVALTIYASFIMLSFIPIIILRRLWNRQHRQTSRHEIAPEQTGSHLFPKSFFPALLVTIGLFVLLILAIFFTMPPIDIRSNTSDNWQHFVILGLIITCPWLIALLCSWQKGSFENEQ